MIEEILGLYALAGGYNKVARHIDLEKYTTIRREFIRLIESTGTKMEDSQAVKEAIYNLEK